MGGPSRSHCMVDEKSARRCSSRFFDNFECRSRNSIGCADNPNPLAQVFRTLHGPAVRGFASRQLIGCCGPGCRSDGTAGVRRFTSCSQRPCSPGIGAAFACSGHGRADIAGRPGVPADVRALIREMSTMNPLWDAPRIHGELQKLGISVSHHRTGPSTVKPRTNDCWLKRELRCHLSRRTLQCPS